MESTRHTAGGDRGRGIRGLRAVFRAHLLSVRFLIWAGLLAVLSAILCFIPLFDLIGFEWCFAIGLAAAPAAIDTSRAWVNRVRADELHALARPTTPARLVLALAGLAALQALALLALPVALIAANALRVPLCDGWIGAAWVLVVPVPAVLTGAVVGVMAALLLRRRWLSSLAAQGFLVVMLAISVYRFYAAPPIFAYDALGGYFPGTLYDESLTIPRALGWYRLYSLAWMVAALAAATCLIDPRNLILRWRRRHFAEAFRQRRGALAVLVGGITLGVFLYGMSARLGFLLDSDSIADALGGTYQTEHFTIYYDRGSPAAREIELIGRDHEFRYAQLREELGVEPEGHHITSFVFASADQKKRLMGAGETYIAKPWRREIYVQYQAFPHDVIKHELAHVFAGAFGDSLFHVSEKLSWLGPIPVPVFNVGLIEGLAVAADWRGGRRLTPHQWTRALIENGMAPSPEALFGYGFFGGSAGRSYTTAGSFVRFLWTAYGIEKLRDVYQSGGDFEGVYGKSLAELGAAWRQAVSTVPLADEDRELAREVFRSPGIFHAPCAHAVAAQRLLAQERAGRGDFAGAARALEDVCREDPDDPDNLLALADAQTDAGDEAAAKLTLERVLAHRKTSATLRGTTLIKLGELAWRRGDDAAARAALGEAVKLPLDDGSTRLARAELLGLTDPRAGPFLRAYFLDQPSTTPLAAPGARPSRGAARAADADQASQLLHAHELAVNLPELGLGSYLVGRILTAKARYAEAVPFLVAAQARGLPDALFGRENDRNLLVAAYRAGDLATARVAAGRLAAPDQPEATRLDAEDWMMRMDWDAGRPFSAATLHPGQK